MSRPPWPFRAVVVVLGVACAAFALGVVVQSVSAGSPPSLAWVGICIVVAVSVAGIGTALAPRMERLWRQRAERARAEERADLGAHLHDVVLQELALIQRRAGNADEVVRLARHSERGLRAWLGGARGDRQDLASAVVAAVDDVEERFGVRVDLVTVGTCRMDRRAGAVVDAVLEALTNAAKHAGTPRMAVLVEVADDEVFALVRDRGQGFDPTRVGRDRRGLSDSIMGRMSRRGGTAVVTSAPGQGTVVELRMPLAAVP